MGNKARLNKVLSWVFFRVQCLGHMASLTLKGQVLGFCMMGDDGCLMKLTCGISGFQVLGLSVQG